MSKYGKAIPSVRRLQTIGPGRNNSTTNKMKLNLKQRIRNWLLDDNDIYVSSEQCIKEDLFQSDGMRFQLYKASGGYVIETRNYDHRKDEEHNKMYVITDDKDLGEELGKIITMESLR